MFVRFQCGSVLSGALLNAMALVLAGEGFELMAGTAFAIHLLIAPVEGLVTAVAVVFLRKVRPELLDAPLLPTHQWDAPKPELEASEVQPDELDDSVKEHVPC